MSPGREEVTVQGTFRAHAVDGRAELQLSKSDNPQVRVEFEIDDGPEKGRRLSWWGNLSDAAFDRTKADLAKLGWKSETWNDVTGLITSVEIVVEEEEYNGKTQSRVRWINEIGGRRPAARPVPAAVVAALDARLRGTVVAQLPTPAGQLTTDEIPF